ncbi:ATP-binding protein [Bdellovibrionota bacterium FG-1]
MLRRIFRAPGLRFQALIISFSLLLLVTLLGIRAYSVARGHFDELSELVHHDLQAQGLLVQMENSSSALDLALRKFAITRDSQYLKLATTVQKDLTQLASSLRQALAIGGQDFQIDPSASGIHKLRDWLEQRREAKLNHAHAAALGLLRLILVAVLLSGIITAWIFTLFYRGLLDPLAQLKDATYRIRSGELAYRLRTQSGVAELQELAESFNLMAERLEQLDQAKTDFLATISHEIKNPLAALKEGINLLASQGDTMAPQAKAKAFSVCLIAAKRLESMINNLLHHSQMETGLFSFDLKLKDIGSAIHTAIDEVRPLAQKKGMTIHYQGNPSIQAAFNWDGLVQVFENLLLNAVKYGNENTTIQIQVQQKERRLEHAELPHLELAVINEGRTISDTDLSRIFERFYRGSNSTLQQGMGLGLHVVKRIIEAHHGKIYAASEAGKTRFEFWIPSRYETEAG